MNLTEYPPFHLAKDNKPKTNTMHLELIKGTFTAHEALELLKQAVNIKIRFYESKIAECQNEEDIKMREQQIKKLQKEYQEGKLTIMSTGKQYHIDSVFNIQSI